MRKTWPIATNENVMLDPEDRHLLEDGCWRVVKLGYVARSKSRAILVAGVEYKLLHRLITGAQPGQHVDHINGNPSDNRRVNLRITNHAGNMRNRTMHKNNRVGFKGVYFDPGSRNYRAQVRHQGRKINLGRFKTPQDAHDAYIEWCRHNVRDFVERNDLKRTA